MSEIQEEEDTGEFKEFDSSFSDDKQEEDDLLAQESSDEDLNLDQMLL